MKLPAATAIVLPLLLVVWFPNNALSNSSSNNSINQRIAAHPKFQKAKEGYEIPGEFFVEFDASSSSWSRINNKEFTTKADFFRTRADDICAILLTCGGFCQDYLMDAVTGVRITHTDDECVLRILEQEKHDDFRVYQGEWFTKAEVQTEDMDKLWGLDRMDQEDNDLDERYEYEFDGSGVEVYIADTGISASHPEFAGRSIECAYDAIGSGCIDDDDHGHGTHVAGTACGRVVGVAKNCILKALKVLGPNGGSVFGVIVGLNTVVARANDGVGSRRKIINFSLGGPSNSLLAAAIGNAVEAGVLVVAAAGNEDDDACDYSPADVPDALTVGSVSIDGRRYSSSNYGPCVDVFAPGSSIYSSVQGGRYAYLTGTSMASPHLAGAAALFWQQSPDSDQSQIIDAMLADSLVDEVIDPGTGSPNLLATTYRLNQRGQGGDPPPSGTPPPPPPPPAGPPTPSGGGDDDDDDDNCVDTANWRDDYDEGCDWYEKYDSEGCPGYGGTPGTGGMTGKQACCWCKKSNPDNPPPPVPPSRNNCADQPVDWEDGYDDGCYWYELYDRSGCPDYGAIPGTAGMTAKEACCWCGGGLPDE